MTKRAPAAWLGTTIAVSIVLAFARTGESVAADVRGSDSTVLASALSLIVDGGTVTLIDPLGRVNSGGASPRSGIPNCSRIEGHTQGVHSTEEAMAPRAELDLLSPMRGRYRIRVHAERSIVLVQAMGEFAGVRCGSADYLNGAAGRTLEWSAWWGASVDSGRCQLKLERTPKSKPSPPSK